ncbi:MAG: hypothetical protein D6722_08190 [Bacteroidetes bacterium]|nr:MAG: hypothetical protein D6722_08190 [Bacteroidota bacterium]
MKSLYLGVSLLLIGFILACNPDPVTPVPEKKRTYLHILNAYAGLDRGVDIRFRAYDESRIIADGIRFQESWPSSGYASLLAPVILADSATERVQGTLELLDNATKEILHREPLDLRPEAMATYCVVDSFGKPLLVKADDQPLPYTPNAANVRFMNLSHLLRSVSLVSQPDSVRINGLNFLLYSPFELTGARTYTFYVLNQTTGTPIDSIPNVTLKPRTAYNFYLTQENGFPKAGYVSFE